MGNSWINSSWWVETEEWIAYSGIHITVGKARLCPFGKHFLIYLMVK